MVMPGRSREPGQRLGVHMSNRYQHSTDRFPAAPGFTEEQLNSVPLITVHPAAWPAAIGAAFLMLATLGAQYEFLHCPALGRDRDGNLDVGCSWFAEQDGVGCCFHPHRSLVQPLHSGLRHTGILGSVRHCGICSVLGRRSQATRFEARSVEPLAEVV